MSFLSELLELDALDSTVFDQRISDLERRSGNKNIDVRISGKIREGSAKIVKELGFFDTSVRAEEVFNALINKIRAGKILISDDEKSFWDRNKARVILADDGVVSVNMDDLEEDLNNKLDYHKRTSEHFKSNLMDEIAREYSEVIPNFSKENILKKLS